MDYTEIAYEVADRVAVITLDRPERLNAFTTTMMHELIDAFDQVDADDDVRVVIVTGRGRGFCAGADLGLGGETFDAAAVSERELRSAPRDGGGLLTLRIFECTKPVIAAMNGSAVGIGVTMTLPMDIRVLADNAKVGFVFASRGIVPEAASSWFLPRVVGINQALEWCLTARVFGAEEALAGGLVRSIHPADEVLAVAHTLAAGIVEHAAPVSAALTRHMLWRMLGADHPMEAHKVDSRGVYDTGRGADAREGVMSFLEKRPPEWSLRPSQDMPEWFPWWEERRYE
ncbi:MAG TPA: crotonase/enoyl-CoA hydratase family protein [Acidimicrobiales bacterium]